MALNFIKKLFKKKERKKDKKIDLDLKPEAEAKETQKEDKKELKILPEILKISDEVVFHLIKPHLTEKTSLIAGQNKYVFWVKKKSNKIEIKKAVEKLYGVNVVSVNTLNPKPKEIRIGRVSGLRPTFKKAIVTLAEGQKIEV